MDIASLPKFYIRGVIAPADVMFMGNEEYTSANDIRNFLSQNDDSKEVVFEISSNGGYVSEGFKMHDIIKNCGKKVYTIGYRVNSIAVMPFLAGSKRYLSENAEFVIHNARIDPSDLPSRYLTAEDLSLMAADTAKTDKRILDAYCDILGEDKRSKLLALLSNETDLGSTLAIKLGFANGLWKSKSDAKVKNYSRLCVDEFWDDKREIFQNIIQNKINMDNEKLKEAESNISKLFKAVKNILKVKNEISLELEDGTLLSVSGDGDLIGQTALTVVDGMPSDPAPDGTHKLKDGRSIVIEGGVITEVIESENVNALKEEIANLKTQLEAKNLEAVNLSEALNKATQESSQKLNELEEEFKKFKNLVPGDESDKKQKREHLDISKMSERERIFYNQKQRFKNK